MSKISNTASVSEDQFDHGLLSPAQTSKVVTVENLAACDSEMLALHIKSILSSASETTDAIATRLIKIKAAENPLLTAAQPLLLTLASLPKLDLSADTVPAFHALLVYEIETFQKLCTQADLPRDHVIAASYALCTALDEAANGTEWGGGSAAATVISTASNIPKNKNKTDDANADDSVSTASASASASVSASEPSIGTVGVWASQMLAASFHNNTAGGIKVFQMIGRLMSHKPEGHIDLLELLHRILSLGFEGQYRSLPDGRRQHDTIRQRIYVVLSQARPSVPLALSPHWQGAGPGKFKLLRSLPIWVTASVLGLASFSLFAWYKYQLVQQSDVLLTEITAIGKMTPPPEVVLPLRLSVLLKDEIAQGKVSVSEDALRSQVTFKGDDMFIAGQAAMNPKIKPLLDKVATEIARVSGMVKVTGHSDNQPIRTSRFPNNQVLSEERATAVGNTLQAAGVAAGRIDMRGQGDTAPIADNATAAGRAKNRRVEISITTLTSPIAIQSSATAPSAP